VGKNNAGTWGTDRGRQDHDWSGREAGGLETRVVERPVILWTNMPKPEFTYTSEQNRVNEKKTSFYLEKGTSNEDIMNS